MRPHDIEILGTNGASGRGKVRYINATGPVARVELAIDGLATPVEAELSRQKLDELALRPGQPVMVQARSARIFPVDSAA